MSAMAAARVGTNQDGPRHALRADFMRENPARRRCKGPWADAETNHRRPAPLMLRVAFSKRAHDPEQRAVRMGNCVAPRGCRPQARRQWRRDAIAKPSNSATNGEGFPRQLGQPLRGPHRGRPRGRPTERSTLFVGGGDKGRQGQTTTTVFRQARLAHGSEPLTIRSPRADRAPTAMRQRDPSRRRREASCVRALRPLPPRAARPFLRRLRERIPTVPSGLRRWTTREDKNAQRRKQRQVFWLYPDIGWGRGQGGSIPAFLPA